MRRVALVTLALVALVACATAGGAPAPVARHVVLLSIDGLRPEFYLDPSFAAPALRAMAAEGAHARAVESVFPSLTYPSHATIATGVRPARHAIAFNLRFEEDRPRGRWFEEASDLRAPPLWAWARGAGLTTAAVSWPSTLGAPIDWLIAERDFYLRPHPMPDFLAATTPGLFERLGLTPEATMFRDPARWDAFLTAVAAGIIREHAPRLLLLHLIETDVVQHQGGRDGAAVRPALARIDTHVATLRAALAAAGLAGRTAFIVTGDHGFQDVDAYVYPNHVLAREGLRGCPQAGDWRATAHAAGGGGAVFVAPAGDAVTIARAEAALRREAHGRYAVLTRAELDALGAMPGAALGLEALPGWAIGSSCDRGATEPSRVGRGTHGFLPSRPSMATGLIAAGAGVRKGAVLDRARLVDVAPTAARLLGIPAPPVEGRVLTEILE